MKRAERQRNVCEEHFAGVDEHVVSFDGDDGRWSARAWHCDELGNGDGDEPGREAVLGWLSGMGLSEYLELFVTHGFGRGGFLIYDFLL